MSTVFQVIKRLCPRGITRDKKGKKSWKRFPFWPPDTFAVAATLVDLSGCYAHPCFAGDKGPPSVLTEDVLRELVNLVQSQVASCARSSGAAILNG